MSPPSFLAASHDVDPWLVACLCAAWCGTCREFRAAFDALAARHGHVRFRWIDIEDEADLADGYEVENFPTLLIQCGGRVLFYGAVLPQAAIVDRQLAALHASQDARAMADVPDLLARLTGR